MVADCAPQIAQESRPVAKRAHRCCECRTTIEPGTRYARLDGRYDDGWRTYTTCAPCDALREQVCDGNGYIFGELADAACEWARDNQGDPALAAFEERTAASRARQGARGDA